MQPSFADMEAMLTDVLLEQAEAAVPACNAELTSGTTACVVLRRGPEAFVANLGDSRAVVSKGGGSLQKRLTLTGLAIWGFQPFINKKRIVPQERLNLFWSKFKHF